MHGNNDVLCALRFVLSEKKIVKTSFDSSKNKE